MRLKVRASGIASLLDQVPAPLACLSLDCFDTLLWRDTQAPRDVFAGIDLPGGGLEPRMWAEGAARRGALARGNTAEVSIEQVYARLLPAADRATREAAIAHELALETRHCFAFAPVVTLMREARARGLTVVIVSDTYLSEVQLRALIAAAAGDEVLALIDRVFVSSAHGVGKSGGLFRQVLAALKVAPASILHLGDNKLADLDAPAALGLHACHFEQFEALTEQRLRLEAAAAALIDPTTRVTATAAQPHRPALSLRAPADDAWTLGHDVMGPVMHGFARWLGDEVAALSETLGKPVRPLFLLRDGHLPLAAYRALHGAEAGTAIEVSRFTAACAHLTTRAALADFVADSLDRLGPALLARQLMLHGHEAAKVVRAKGRRAVQREVMALAPKILARAAALGDRLVAHLASAGVAPGDAVMLVDLGYNGTVQNLVQPFLEQRLGLSVAGGYLLLREEQRSGLDKAGLIDTRHYETRALHAMCATIAVIEQLCTVAQGSVTDYTPAGEPVRRAADIKGAQSAIRERVQAGCLAFVENADAGVHRPALADGPESRRRMAAATLARLLFMPVDQEVRLFEAFDHDVNLGTDQVVRLLDTGESAQGLKRRGLSYLNETGRMYVPGELAGHGLPLNLSLLSASRFALDLRNADFEVGGVELPVLLVGATEQAIHRFEARPTAQGFHRVVVPVERGRWTPAVQLGALCAWAQVDDARWLRLDQFDDNAAREGAPAILIPDGMEEQAPGLYRCSPAGFLMAPPPPGDHTLVLQLVFRPVVWRAEADAALARAA